MRPSTVSRLLLLGFALTGFPSPRAAHAQQATGTGSIVGVAYDSVRMRPLGGAQVEIEGTTIVTLAGPNGLFYFDSVPAGDVRLRANHPILDTLGIGLVAAFKIVAGQPTKVQLATPTPETLVSMFCSPQARFLGPSALFGRVRDADTGKPTVSAVVSLVWYQTDLTGLRKIPKEKRGTVAADGSYRVCGLPRALDGKVQVQMAGVPLGGDIPMVFTDEVLRLRSMSTSAAGISTEPTPVAAPTVAAAPTRAQVPPPGAAAAADSSGTKPPPVTAESARAQSGPPAPALSSRVGRAKLTGTVVNETGQPLAAARVQLDGNIRATLTNQRGAFSLDSLPSGSQVVIVRLLGYTPGQKEVELSAAEPQKVTVTMSKAVATLSTVVAQAARDRGLDAVGFSQRERSGLGWYMNEEAIKKHGGSVFSELIRANPSVRIDPSGYGQNVIVNAREPVSGCVTFVVDGSPFQQMSPGDIDNYVRPEDIGAIEVYSGSNTPAEFQQPGMSGCLYIIIWTKFKLNSRGKR